jgi:hypothetical protein
VTKIRVFRFYAQGQLLLGKQAVSFELEIDGPRVSAAFGEIPEGHTHREAFQALEEFVDAHLRGE